MSNLLLGSLHASAVLAIAWCICRCWPSRLGFLPPIFRVATLAVYAVSIAAFMPIPSYTLSIIQHVNVRSQRLATASQTYSAEASPNGSVSSIGLPLDLSLLSTGNGEAVIASSEHDRPWKTWGRACFVLVFFSILVISLSRQLLGLWSLRWLYANSFDVSDPRCVELLAELVERIGCVKPRMRCSDWIRSAGTAGWLRPVILLPKNYVGYSDQELRAVLAHELAHIKRGDFVWRFMVGFYAAAQFYNPLAHWLRQRLVLEQELRADEIASQVVGSRAYVRMLSRFAMQAETQEDVMFQTGMLSVTSTNLLRRIDMLRAKDGSIVSTTGAGAWAIGMVAMVTTTIAVTGLRAGDVPPSHQKAVGSHAHPVFDVNVLPESGQGAFVIRPSQLVDDALGTQASELRHIIAQAMQELRLGQVDIGKIAYIGGTLKCEVRHSGKTIEPGDEGHEHQLVLGAGAVLIGLQEPQDLVARIKELFPKAEELDSEKQIFLLQLIHAAGPYRTRLRVVDNQTLALSFSPKSNEWLDDFEQRAGQSHRWAEQWRTVDQGAVTILLDEEKVSWPITMKNWPKYVREAIEKTRFVGLALSAGRSPRLSCNATAKSGVPVSELVTAAQRIVRELRSQENGSERSFLLDWVDALKVSDLANGVHMEGPIVFPLESETDSNGSVPVANGDPQQAIRLQTKLVEMNVEKLKKLNVEHLRIEHSGKMSRSELGHSLAMFMNRDPKASLALIEKTCGRGKPGSLGQVLAAPSLTTTVERPASFRSKDVAIRFVPHFPDGEFLSLDLEFSGVVEWKTNVLTRIGRPHFLPLPASDPKSETRLVLVLTSELERRSGISVATDEKSDAVSR